MDKSMSMNWRPYKQGHLTKCSHGYYFVYRKFNHELGSNRWFAEYEAGADMFGEQGSLTGKIHGYETLEEAKADCEKDAKDVEGML
jgi:hypothetical protein